MPDLPAPKVVPHPWKSRVRVLPTRRLTLASTHGVRRRRVPYAELQVTTAYSFLRGASQPEELVQRAAELGHVAAAVADHGTLGGVVRAHVAARDAGIPLAVGARLDLTLPAGVLPPGERLGVLVYPTDRRSYGTLCRLLTVKNRRVPKEDGLALADLLAAEASAPGGLLAVVVPPERLTPALVEALLGLRAAFDDDRLSLAAALLLGPDDRSRLRDLRRLSADVRVPLAAVGDVHYHVPERRALQDVLTCVRHGCTVAEAGFRLFPNAERHLQPAAALVRRFVSAPAAVARSAEVARRAATFSLDLLRYEYPRESCPAGMTPTQHLADLVRQGAAARYPAGVPASVRAQVENELAIIDELSYAPYFLTVHDLVAFARSRRILCQGRGAAANSAVCYCLGITALDPSRVEMLFERFVSRERNEPPDIDIDFEHERREEVIQHVYAKYGRERAAMTAEMITYRGRSAVRDVGKALGFTLDAVERIAKEADAWDGEIGGPERLREIGFDVTAPAVQRLLRLCGEIVGIPRHRSQHVGGMVMTQGPLCEMVPIADATMPERTVIEWDKDDVDAAGMLKVDLLGLGMLTCIRKAFALVGEAAPAEPAALEPSDGSRLGALALHTVPSEDPAVYDMLCAADAVGVFQVESRAQMAMLPRLKPRCLYDLVIEVALVRPGPIQGDMVHPYLRRRDGLEPVTYPDAAVEKVLGRTLGIPLFQEQAMALAIVAAGFTPGEADRLRRAMAAWKRRTKEIDALGVKLVEGMVARGYPRGFAERCFRQIQGFSEYGFPESHAASFALIVYVSAWLKRHHPAAFAAALLNSQPMGFYAPAQIVRDARDHGVEVRPVDVHASGWDCRLERDGGGPPALRLGLRLAKGLGRTEADRLARAVEAHGRFASVDEVHRRAGLSTRALHALAAADAFGSLGLTRQQALWDVAALGNVVLPLFDAPVERARPEPSAPPARSTTGAGLPPVPPGVEVLRDYASTGLSLRAHPVSFVREHLEAAGVLPLGRLTDAAALPHRARAVVAGVVLVRQRPSTAKGILFMTIEDETGIANLVVHPDVYERFRRAARHGRFVKAHGRVERAGAVTHLVVATLESLDSLYAWTLASCRDFR